MRFPEATHTAATPSPDVAPSTSPRVTPPVASSDIFSVTIINRQEDIARRGDKAARDRVRDEQRRSSWRRPGTVLRSLVRRYGEDYFVQKRKQQHREAAFSANNAYIATLPSGGVDTETHRAAAEAAAQAKIEQVKLGKEIFRRDIDTSAFQHVERATAGVKELLVNRLISNVVSGKLTEEADVQAEMRNIVRFATQRKADPEVREQMNRLFGKNAVASGQRAEYFATDILQRGRELREHINAVGILPAEALRNIEITLANTSWGAETQQESSALDRRIQKIRQTAAGTLFNETTLGAAASVITFASVRAAGRGAAWAAGSGIGAGALVGGAMAAHERSRLLKIDRASHEADREYGLKIAEDAPQRARLDAFGLSRATVNELLETDRTTMRDGRSLRTLLNEEQTDLSSSTSQEALANRIAEIETRLLYSARKQVGLIEYPGEFTVEQARLDLIKGIVQGRKQLREAYQREGVKQERAQQLADAMIAKEAAAWEQRFADEQSQQNKKFTIFRRKSALRHGMGGAAIGAVSGAIISTVSGWFNRSSNYAATGAVEKSPTSIDGNVTSIPVGTELQKNSDGSYDLVASNDHGQKLLQHIRLTTDPNGAAHLAYDHTTNIIPDDTIQVSQTSHTEMQETHIPNDVANDHLAAPHIDSQRWYHPSRNEHRLHTIKEGNGVRILPVHMGVSQGRGMTPLDVPHEASQGKLEYAFHLAGHTEAVIARSNAPDGSLLLDPTDTDVSHQIVLEDGRQIQKGLFSKMVINQAALAKAPQGDIATEMTGRQDIFALGNADGKGGTISLGEFNPQTAAWRSIAQLHGTGAISDSITSTQSVRIYEKPSISISGTVTATQLKPGMPVVIVPKFRKPLDSMNPAKDTYSPIDLTRSVAHPGEPVAPQPQRQVTEPVGTPSVSQPPVEEPVSPVTPEIVPSDVFHDELEVQPTSPHVAEVLRGLMLQQQHYTEIPTAEKNGTEVKAEVRTIIANYLKNAVQRGTSIEEAQARFRSFFNFMALREAKSKYTLKQKDVKPLADEDVIFITDSVSSRLREHDIATREDAIRECTSYLRSAPDMVRARDASVKRIIDDLVDAFLAKKEIAQLKNR